LTELTAKLLSENIKTFNTLFRLSQRPREFGRAWLGCELEK
jgi:hypothetical protein